MYLTIWTTKLSERKKQQKKRNTLKQSRWGMKMLMHKTTA